MKQFKPFKKISYLIVNLSSNIKWLLKYQVSKLLLPTTQADSRNTQRDAYYFTRRN